MTCVYDYGWRQGFSATCNFERVDSRVKVSYEKGVYFIIENTVLEFFKLGAQNGCNLEWFPKFI